MTEILETQKPQSEGTDLKKLPMDKGNKNKAYMKVMRLLEEQGQTFTLPDSKRVKAYVEEILPGGFAGFAKEKEKTQKAGTERYKAAKQQVAS